jgi:CRP/FNR family transcriptional regulator, anaerobic regulatory protein
MAARRDRSTYGEGEVPLPMSRTDIADYLGLSRESVSRAARELLRRHLVRFENPHLLRIVDATGLAKIAASV